MQQENPCGLVKVQFKHWYTSGKSVGAGGADGAVMLVLR